MSCTCVVHKLPLLLHQLWPCLVLFTTLREFGGAGLMRDTAVRDPVANSLLLWFPSTLSEY